MSQIERAYKALEKHVSIIKYLKDNYPSILKEWSNGPNVATTGHQTDLAEGKDNAT